MVANHPQDCLVCDRSGSCELADLTQEVGVRPRQYVGMKKDQHLDISSPAIWRDPNKCVLCGRCVTMCHQIQGIGAIDFTDRGLPHPGGAGLLARASTSRAAPTAASACGSAPPAPSWSAATWTRWWPRWATRTPWWSLRSPRPCRPPSTRSGTKHAGRPRDAGAPGRGPQAHRLRRRVRHRLRRRPHHHGRGHRAGGAGQERRRASHVHQLLAGLGQLRGAAPARPHPPHVHLQVAPADGRRPHQGDLPQVRRPRAASAWCSSRSCPARPRSTRPRTWATWTTCSPPASSTPSGAASASTSTPSRSGRRSIRPFAEATGAARLFGGTGGVMEAAVRTAATLVGARGSRRTAHRGARPRRLQVLHVDVNGTHPQPGRRQRPRPAALRRCDDGPGRHALRGGHVVPGRLRRAAAASPTTAR